MLIGTRTSIPNKILKEKGITEIHCFWSMKITNTERIFGAKKFLLFCDLNVKLGGGKHRW